MGAGGEQDDGHREPHEHRIKVFEHVLFVYYTGVC